MDKITADDIKRADRELKRYTKQQEKEARKKAKVPTPEWKLQLHAQVTVNILQWFVKAALLVIGSIIILEHLKEF